MNSDGKQEVVVHHNGKRTVWNSRNEQVKLALLVSPPS